MYTKSTKEKRVSKATNSANSSANTHANTSTTIRINQIKKEKVENLDFVRKHTFDEILNELIDFYEKNKEKTRK